MIHSFAFIYICQQIKKLGGPTLEQRCAVAWAQAQVVNSNSTSAVQDPSSGGELKLYLSCRRIQAQVVNSNSTSAVQDPHSGGELKLYLGCTGSTLRWRTQTLPRLYRIQAQVVNSNSTSVVQDPSSGGELKLYLGCTGSMLRW